MCLRSAIVATLFMIGGCASGPQVGQPVPAFEAVDSTGQPVGLAAYAGQVLILDFFGVW